MGIVLGFSQTLLINSMVMKLLYSMIVSAVHCFCLSFRACFIIRNMNIFAWYYRNFSR